MSDRRPAGQPAIALRGLTKSFGPTRVLDGVDLDVQRGEIVALAGPSGAGKSTLLHLIAALDVPSAGSITVGGRAVSGHHHLTRYRRSEVGIIFQLHNLIPRLSAVQNVELAMFGTGYGHWQRHARAIELLERVELGHRLKARPPTLSGGERQRVAIARSLANRPPVLLADEPTGSLDDAAAANVIGLLAELRERDGCTILAVNHDPRLERIVDRTLWLADGRLDRPRPGGTLLSAPARD